VGVLKILHKVVGIHIKLSFQDSDTQNLALIIHRFLNHETSVSNVN
jgi:hypothetical protein